MTERTLQTSIETELSAFAAQFVAFVYFNFPGGARRFWSGVGDISWSGETWEGNGELVSFDKVTESVGQEDVGTMVNLNFVIDSIRNEVVTNDPVGEDASIYFGTIDKETRAIVADEIFPGYIDEISMTDGGVTGIVKIRIASEWAKLSKTRAYRMTNAHQQRLFAGDEGLEFVGRMGDPIVWGRATLQPHYGAPGSPPRQRPRRDRRPTTY